ncbi:TetR/AcrR family transcriptional regulator [Lachnospiraceae bacterium]|nr:TetR/AcrR family transcriptional regulator [Lachnospiraceae bacterium]
MRENDLRVIKTRKAIHDTFLMLIKRKPVDKITVTELAREAYISKGTFYLHYQDIPQLYEHMIFSAFQVGFRKFDAYSLLLENPAGFLETFQNQIYHSNSELKTLLQPGEVKNYQVVIIDMLVQETYARGIFTQSTENDVCLTALFGAMLTIMPNYDKAQKTVEAVFAKMTNAILMKY